MPNQIDLNKFKNVLPYSSELFGVYQPLLGWKSKRTIERFHPGVKDSQLKIVDALLSKMHPDIDVVINDYTNDDIHFNILKLNMGTLNPPNRTSTPPTYRFFITDLIQKRIFSEGYTIDNINWEKLVGEEALQNFLATITALLELTSHDISFIINSIPADIRSGFKFSDNKDQVSEILHRRIETESSMAGTLNELFKLGKFDLLIKIFFPEDKIIDINQLDDISRFLDPMENFDPKTDISNVSLSPIGIVHLFRQYFFEFDTFLGSPVQHIWLSPGSSLELIEIHTRKQIQERTVESSIETTLKSEKSSTEQDDLSDAVKEENQSNTKFGMSINAGGTVSGGTPGIYSATGHVDTTTSYGLENNQKTAKEAVYKQMKQQSEKLSSEIKKNFKTTFKTTTEVQDTTSKRYVLQNNKTDELINYELRRKMRQVGVQVQDIGTSLCWQTYVDLPGDDLGIANLVHIAEPPDFGSIPHPEQGAMPAPTISKDLTTKLDFNGWEGLQNDTNRTYVEADSGSDKGISDDIDKIHLNYYNIKVEEIPGYNLHQVLFDGCVEGKMVEPYCYPHKDDSAIKNAFDIHLKKVNFDGDSLTLKLKLIYFVDEAVTKAIDDKYKLDMIKYDAEKAKLFKETLIKEARDRIKVAGNIQPRNFEELREEERTIVYRFLIKDLLNVGVEMLNPQIKHIMAELINSMFDVDKMLYFTAPEWWVPRKHTLTNQNVGSPTSFPGADRPSNIFSSADIVSWGGSKARNRPNYFITEDSAPAKLGSSLGWMLQLDGDNIRNAFLNAPWVKAVIPIKPGKELSALNWLMKANVEGASGIKAQYQEGSDEELDKIILFLEEYPFDSSDPRKDRYEDFSNKINDDPGTFFVTIEDALISLSLQIKTKYEDANKLVTEMVDGEVKRYLPTEKVFEHGFDPLQGGFKAETVEQFALCGQWVEVLPTDQIVAVEVEYDPITGRQI